MIMNLVSSENHGRVEYSMENILEKRIKVEIKEDEIFNFLCKIAADCKFWSQ